MIRAPLPSSPHAGAPAPGRSRVAHPFEVVYQALLGNEGVVLQSAADANEATTAFHEALRRLTEQGATGELLVRTRHHADHPLLRLPLTHQR